MDDHAKVLLENGGVDVQSLLDRCMGSEPLLLRLLNKFPADAPYTRLSSAMEAKDATAALEASHTLKGVCGNLSLTRLFALLDKQVQALRAGDMAGAQELMPHIAQAHATALRAIEESQR